MLKPGDAIPHFEVSTIGGDVFSYSNVWQPKNLVLVAFPPSIFDDSGYLAALSARCPEFQARESVCVMTRNRVPWLPARNYPRRERRAVGNDSTAARESRSSRVQVSNS